MRVRSLLALSLALAALPACQAFRAQHSTEMWKPADSQPPHQTKSTGSIFSRVQNEVFTPHCALSGCHVTMGEDSGRYPPEDLILEPGKSWEMLVGVPSNQWRMARVSPGDPEQSYLLRKITPDAEIFWSRMPLKQPPLSNEQRQLVRDWIAAGAPRD